MGKYLFWLARKVKPGMLAFAPMLLLLSFILLNIAIWWAGPWYEIAGSYPLTSVVSRAIASVGLTLLCAAIWGLLQWRKLQGYQQKQEREERFRQDPIKIFEERQEAELNHVIANMEKNLKKRDPLYALPWYLVLGLEEAGKTSLINRSGQNFTLSLTMRASGKKSENSYSFDWWIGDQSVLIDPNGKLISQGYQSVGRDVITYNQDGDDGETERRLWKHFVEWLESKRTRRPLNGVVLTVDIAHLATANTSERLAYAHLLRARLKELVETIAVENLPVYVALTKLDLLYGFEACFKNLSKEEREQAFGFTFKLDDEHNVDAWLEQFIEEYDAFVQRINRHIPTVSSTAMSHEERSALYSFSRQLAGLKDILAQFFRETLTSDQFSMSAMVRGTYFTSVYQQGVPTNAFDDAASRRYGLAKMVNRAQNAKNSTIFFTPNLFRDVIYAEAGLAKDNKKVTQKKRRLVGLTVAACSIASALLIGSWQRYYSANVQHSDAVLTQVNQFKNELPENIYAASQQDILDALNNIRQATLEFGYFREKSSYMSDMGLYQGRTIGPMVEDTYLNLLRTRYLPMLMSAAIVNLNQAETDDDKLAALRVYRMLTDSQGRYKNIVLDYFSRYWQQEYPGRRVIQEQLNGHLDYAMDHTDLARDRANGDETAEQVLRPFEQNIAQAQINLGTIPNEQRVYRNLKLNAQTVLVEPAINLRSLVGPVFDMVFEEQVMNGSGLYIPQMLTKKGFEEYFVPQMESVSELALVDSWVLGQSHSAEFSEADKQALRDKVRQLYVSDYTRTWQAAISEINMKYFGDMNDAVTVLDNITGNIEPLQRLLRTLESNTQLFSDFDDDELAKNALLKSAKYQVAAEIDKPFSDLNRMLEPVGNKPAYINEVLASVDDLKLYLKGIQTAPDMGMAALDATKARMKLVNADPIYTLKRIASGLPKPLDRMIAKLADESWYVVKQEAIKYLEVRWHNDVYRAFEEKLADRYPFNPASRKDASLADFEEFFAPNGTLQAFYDNQLKIFVDEHMTLTDDEDGQSVVKSEVLEQIHQAQQIREAFFNRKGILDVSFSIEPLRLTGNKRRSVLNVDGQFLTYSHGPRENVELIWPNTLRDSAVSKITLIPTKSNLSPRSMVIQGPWAFFRLLDQGDVVAASTTSVDYKFTVDGGDMVYRVNSEANVNPFTQRLFHSFRLSNSLY